MSSIWIAFICGLFLGVFAGVVLMCLCFVAKEDELHQNQLCIRTTLRHSEWLKWWRSRETGTNWSLGAGRGTRQPDLLKKRIS